MSPQPTGAASPDAGAPEAGGPDLPHGDLPHGDLFEAHPQPMWVSDADTRRILFVNRAAIDRYGYTREEFLALTDEDLRAPADSGDDAGISRHRTREGTPILAEISTRAWDLSGRQVRLVMVQDVTQRRATEERLRRAEKLLQTAERLAHVGGWLVELATMTVEWSDEVCAIHEVQPGFRPTVAEAIAFYAPEWRDRIGELVGECARAGTPFTGELEIVTARGRRRWVRATGEAVRDADGCIRRVQGAFQDISDRKQAEFSLRQSEARLRAIFEHEPECVKLVALDGRLLDINPAGLRMIEAGDRAEVVGTPVLGLVHPDERELYQSIHDAAAAGLPRQGLFRFRGRAGTERWVESHATPMRGADGSIGSVLSVARDVTARREAETALAAAREQHRRILDCLADGVHVLDLEGRILHQNPAAMAMLGWPEEEILGRRSHSSIHHHRRDGSEFPVEECSIYRTIRDGVARRVEGELFFRRDGSGFPVEYVCSALRDGSGAITGAVVVFRDVSEQERERAQRATETAILGRIAADAPLPEILDAVALGIEGMMPGSLIAIVLVDEDGRRLRHGAAPRLPADFRRWVDGMTMEPEAGSCAAAILRGEPVIAADIETDPQWQDHRDRARMYGFRACWAVPIRNATGRVLACFALYWREPRAPLEAELALVSRWSSTAAIAIERARTVQSLKSSEERFRQLAENIEEAFWMSDPTGQVILYASPAYETIWGRSRAELYADPQQWLQAIHEDDRDRIAQALEHHAAGQYSSEYRVVRPDGEVRWVFDRAFPVHDQAGAVYRVVGTARDITDQKRAERALLDSERRFQGISRATADVLWDWDLETDSLWWGEGFEQSFGYDPHAVASGALRRACIHPDDRDRVVAEVRAAMAGTDELWRSEYRFRHRDGSYFDVVDRGCLLRDQAGRPIRFVGGMTDITDRKRSQQELRERIKELRCLYRVLQCISEHARPADEICQDIARILPSSVLHDGIAVARVALETGEHRSEAWAPPVVSMRARVTGGNAQLGFVEIGYRELPRGYPVGAEMFLPEEWAMVEAVATHIGHMLHNRRIAARLMQSERLGAVGELTGGVAHDFNNLLTVILGNAEQLAEALSDRPELAGLALMTRVAAERGADLTHHLLAFARRQPLTPAVTDIAALIQDMRGLLRRTLGEHIEIDTVGGDGLWQALVDPPQLENAVLNLCINARDAMPLGGRLVIGLANVQVDETYAAWNEDLAPGPYVRITVSDTGTGMPPDVVARAFEPFFTTKEVGKGSGLGLSMVYGFSKQSKGHVRIYSEPGEGTTVRMYLPRAEREAEQSEGSMVLGDIPGGSETILLVEDDEMVREHVAGQLRGLGYRVISVASGRAALEVLERGEALDLLFTDVVMPGGMNGRQLADAARKLRPALPVLFTSGYAEDTIVHNGRLDPGVTLLNKPYRRLELATKIREVLAGGSG